MLDKNGVKKWGKAYMAIVLVTSIAILGVRGCYKGLEAGGICAEGKIATRKAESSLRSSGVSYDLLTYKRKVGEGDWLESIHEFQVINYSRNDMQVENAIIKMQIADHRDACKLIEIREAQDD